MKPGVPFARSLGRFLLRRSRRRFVEQRVPVAGAYVDRAVEDEDLVELPQLAQLGQRSDVVTRVDDDDRAEMLA